MQDNLPNEEKKLYPLATNKDFGLVYAVPKKIKNPEVVANKLYDLFDKENIEKEIEEMLDDDDFFKQEEGEGVEIDEEKKEFRKIKKELELELRKKEVIEKYIKKLSKKNDPYEPIKKKVDKNIIDKIIEWNIDGIDYLIEKYRYYPEQNIASHISGFVGYFNEKKIGQYGLEGFFNEELSGKFGTVKAEKSANRKIVIINDREYKKQLDGSNLILTINRSIEYVVCKKLKKSAIRHGADSGTVIVMEPNTGAILAMCSWPDYNPNDYSDIEDINQYNKIKQVNNQIVNNYYNKNPTKALLVPVGFEKCAENHENSYIWPSPVRKVKFYQEFRRKSFECRSKS